MCLLNVGHGCKPRVMSSAPRRRLSPHRHYRVSTIVDSSERAGVGGWWQQGRAVPEDPRPLANASMHATRPASDTSSTAISSSLLDGRYRATIAPTSPRIPQRLVPLLDALALGLPLRSVKGKSLHRPLALGFEGVFVLPSSFARRPVGSTDRPPVILTGCQRPEKDGDGCEGARDRTESESSVGLEQGVRAAQSISLPPASALQRHQRRTDYGGEHSAGALEAVSFAISPASTHVCALHSRLLFLPRRRTLLPQPYDMRACMA
jgi:hypothetical protein